VVCVLHAHILDSLCAGGMELLSQRPVIFVVNYMDGRENCLVIFEEEIVAAALIEGAVKLLLIISCENLFSSRLQHALKVFSVVLNVELCLHQYGLFQTNNEAIRLDHLKSF
jgi:hypothetical protein